MSDESLRWLSMLWQANILQPATVEAIWERNLKADYRLIPSCYETEALS